MARLGNVNCRILPNLEKIERTYQDPRKRDHVISSISDYQFKKGNLSDDSRNKY